MEDDRGPDSGSGESDFTLETDRLSLAPLTSEEQTPLHALFTDPDVRRYLLDDQIVPEEWVGGEIERSYALFAELGCGLWSIRRRSDAEIVGFVGFRHFFEPPELQLVYGLHPACWGAGLATEAARAVLRYVFGRLGFERVVAATDIPNEASVRVMNRLGMVKDKETDDGEAGTVFYTLDHMI